MKKEYRVLVLPSASQDLNEAVENLENFKSNAGMNLVQRYDEILDLLEASPYLYSTFEKHIRRAPMNPFKYSVFYFVEESDKDVNILAVLSDRLNPAQIQRLLSL